MTALVEGCSGRLLRFVRGGLVIPAMVAAFTPAAANATDAVASDPPLPNNGARDAVIVNVDQAKLLKLPERTATRLIGNPMIADASVQPGGVAVITAKSYGTTNLVALDRAGNTLMDQALQVASPADRVVVVYRGVDKESYSCAVYCERRLTVGDSPASLTANLQVLGAYNAQAQGLGPQQK